MITEFYFLGENISLITNINLTDLSGSPQQELFKWKLGRIHKSKFCFSYYFMIIVNHFTLCFTAICTCVALWKFIPISISFSLCNSSKGRQKSNLDDARSSWGGSTKAKSNIIPELAFLDCFYNNVTNLQRKLLQHLSYSILQFKIWTTFSEKHWI